MVKEKIVERVEIQAFDFRCLQELKKLDSRIHLGFLTEADNEIPGPSDFNHPDPQIASMWTGGALLKNYNKSIPQMIKSLAGDNPACWEPEDVELTKEALDEAHKLGLKVVVWTWPEHSGTTFDPKMIERLINWGVDGIITDDPGHLISLLAARGFQLPIHFVFNK
ncbi:MAG: hypothetical protein HQK53_04585 [Oligoflexia bacterium]|nr:hypothetical protein [Oligoflexia bacterium]